MVSLVDGLREALQVGDVEAARVAHEAIGRLLGDTPVSANVVGLATARRRA